VRFVVVTRDGGLVLIEDYGLIGDTQTAGLVGRDGSLDWLCLPRFDSGALFARLLGDERHGRWLLGPVGEVTAVDRRYRGDTMILETEFTTADGRVRLTDFMPLRDEASDVVRIVEGLEGRVQMCMELVIRFDYGHVLPWVERVDGATVAVAGPDAVWLRTPVRTRGRGMRTDAAFSVRAGERVPFVLTWKPSHQSPPRPVDADGALDATERYWLGWIAASTYQGGWSHAVRRSLLTLKALTYAPTGGIVAAPTTSLPEQLGGIRNWDYRYCWLRDASFTLQALMYSGFLEEARAWRLWLLRTVAGDPAELQVMYGVAGERRLTEWVAEWLPGYEGVPVRIGNAAAKQFQLDVYGEVVDAFHQARGAGLETDKTTWALERALVSYVEDHWQDPDDGIWEVRSGRRPFTHSRAMAWVAVDRAATAMTEHGLPGPRRRWQQLAERIKREVLTKGYNSARRAFTMSYGSDELDAAVLLLPLVGLIDATDQRMVNTVEAVERELTVDGFLQRYTQHHERTDGLPPGEGAFLACSFWLADNYALQGRYDEARDLFERLLALRNDLGLLSEEYDPVTGRLVGNFPQAFSHIAVINTARHLSAAAPAETIEAEQRSG
jgi:GH15 family glucan-1,4-alpha-glucosidase